MTWLFLLFGFAFTLYPSWVVSQGVGTPLSLEEIIDRHRNDVPCRPLAARIAERGIDFTVTSDVIRKLKMEQICEQVIAEVKRKGTELEERKKFAEEKTKLEDEKKALERAQKLLGESATAKPKPPPPEQVRLVNLGMEMIRQQKYQEALEQSERVLKLNKSYDKAWDLQGDALRGLKRFSEAVASYDKALEINPLDAFLWSKKALALTDLARYEEAIRSFERALDINPTNSRLWALKGDSLFALKRCNEARSSYDKALEIDPKLNLTLEERYQRLKNCGA